MIWHLNPWYYWKVSFSTLGLFLTYFQKFKVISAEKKLFYHICSLRTGARKAFIGTEKNHLIFILNICYSDKDFRLAVIFLIEFCFCSLFFCLWLNLTRHTWDNSFFNNFYNNNYEKKPTRNVQILSLFFLLHKRLKRIAVIKHGTWQVPKPR